MPNQDLLALLETYGGSLSNAAVKKELNLTHAEWEEMKKRHISLGHIRKGRGRGGSVQLVRETVEPHIEMEVAMNSAGPKQEFEK